jgi:dTDP-4-dehydrorhamnose 3,5-epimerase
MSKRPSHSKTSTYTGPARRRPAAANNGSAHVAAKQSFSALAANPSQQDASLLIFKKTPLEGAFVISSVSRMDARGSFARLWCQKQFGENGLETDFVQLSLSRTMKRGTLRGLHFQREPHAEVKLVRCVCGAIFDVIVDLRPNSPTYGRHLSVVLEPDTNLALYIPKGFAHGFQALEDDSQVLYQMSEYYNAEASSGIRWNDPVLGIDWPIRNPFVSDRDQSYPDSGVIKK